MSTTSLGKDEQNSNLLSTSKGKQNSDQLVWVVVLILTVFQTCLCIWKHCLQKCLVCSWSLCAGLLSDRSPSRCSYISWSLKSPRICSHFAGSEHSNLVKKKWCFGILFWRGGRRKVAHAEFSDSVRKKCYTLSVWDSCLHQQIMRMLQCCACGVERHFSFATSAVHSLWHHIIGVLPSIEPTVRRCNELDCHVLHNDVVGTAAFCGMWFTCQKHERCFKLNC